MLYCILKLSTQCLTPPSLSPATRLTPALSANTSPQYNNQNNNQDYGSYNPYGQGANPYAQQDNNNPAYGRPQAQGQDNNYYADEERGGYGKISSSTTHSSILANQNTRNAECERSRPKSRSQ